MRAFMRWKWRGVGDGGLVGEVGGGLVDWLRGVRGLRGLDTLLARLSDAVRNSLADSEGALPTRRRHRDSLTDARDALGHVADAAFPELAAEDVRVALRALGRITGRVDIDEVLDTVFRDFCIGK